MYEVFIESKAFILIDKKKFIELNSPQNHIDYSSNLTLEMLLNAAFNENKCFILFEQSMDLMDQFKSNFNIVKAAGGIVLNQYNKLLMIKRNGFWDLPKGKLEEGEELKFCAMREVEEECGVDGLEIISEKFVSYHMYRCKFTNRDILKPTFWFRMKTDFSDSLIPQTEEGISEVSWLDPTQIKDKIPEMYLLIKRMVEDYYLNN